MACNPLSFKDQQSVIEAFEYDDIMVLTIACSKYKQVQVKNQKQDLLNVKNEVLNL